MTSTGSVRIILGAVAALLSTTLLAGSTAAPSPSPQAKDVTEGRVHIRWMDWGRKAFELATVLKRPVLLYLRSADCRLCAQMERDVFDDPEVVQLLADNVVPIAVDADLRPDLAARYLMRAVPSISYLLPNGEPMYRIEKESSLQRVGAYMSNPDRFRRYLALAVSYMREHPMDLLRKAREVAALEGKLRDLVPGLPPFDRIDALGRQIRDRIDFTNGGFGRGWKTIDDAPYRLFRVLALEGSGASLSKATLTTARQILAAEIHDSVEGGFHHYATSRDWSVPALEKRLDLNSRALRLLVLASLLAPDDALLRAGVASTADFVLSRLALVDGGFALGQQGTLGPDDPGTYFASDAAARETRRPPGIERRFISEYNADVAVALLEAGALLGRHDLEAAGLRTVDVLVQRTYRAGRGFTRTVAGKSGVHVEGLLADQVSGLEALLAAYQVRGAATDLRRAREVAEFCRVNLRHPAGYFLDRSINLAAVGKMKRAVIGFGANGRMALSLWRLSTLTGDGHLRTEAAAVLGALGDSLARLTERDAPYLEALVALRDPPVQIIVSGPPEGTGALALRRAARLAAPAGSVLVPAGVDLAGGPLDLPTDWQASAASAWVCQGERCVGPVHEVADLQETLGGVHGKRIDQESAGQ